jgi:flagellum-specific peptidoglycan hydrolase FlgJ
MTESQKQFLDKAAAAAHQANHLFARMAACEAALESGYGLSGLASEDNNLFGMKQHSHPAYQTVSLPTKEFEKGEWVEVSADWVKYPDWASCFADRVNTLERLSEARDPQTGNLEYPHYFAALRAMDVDTYIREVSASWSTDPTRADKCLAIYSEYLVGTPDREGAD